jgi:hypothetical protein
MTLAAAPLAARTADHSHVTLSTEISRTAPSHAHGSTSRGELTRAPSTDRSMPVIQDCVHVAFPQCSGGN